MKKKTNSLLTRKIKTDFNKNFVKFYDKCNETYHIHVKNKKILDLKIERP